MFYTSTYSTLYCLSHTVMNNNFSKKYSLKLIEYVDARKVAISQPFQMLLNSPCMLHMMGLRSEFQLIYRSKFCMV